MKGLGALLGVLLLLVIGCGSDSESESSLTLSPGQLAGISKEQAVLIFEREFRIYCRDNESGLANALEAMQSGELTAGKGYWELRAKPPPSDEVLTGRVNSEGLASGFLLQFVANQTCKLPLYYGPSP